MANMVVRIRVVLLRQVSRKPERPLHHSAEGSFVEGESVTPGGGAERRRLLVL